MAVTLYIFTIGLLNLALGYTVALWLERYRHVAVWRESTPALEAGAANEARQNNPVNSDLSLDVPRDERGILPEVEPVDTFTNRPVELRDSIDITDAVVPEAGSQDIPDSVQPVDNSDHLGNKPSNPGHVGTSDKTLLAELSHNSQNAVPDLLSEEPATDCEGFVENPQADGERFFSTDPAGPAQPSTTSTVIVEGLENIVPAGFCQDRTVTKSANTDDDHQPFDVSADLEYVSEQIEAFDLLGDEKKIQENETSSSNENRDAYTVQLPTTNETANPLESSVVVKAILSGIGEQYAADLAGLRKQLHRFAQQQDPKVGSRDAPDEMNRIEGLDEIVSKWVVKQQATIEYLDEMGGQFSDFVQYSACIEETSLEVTALLGALSCMVSRMEAVLGDQRNSDKISEQIAVLILKIDEYRNTFENRPMLEWTSEHLAVLTPQPTRENNPGFGSPG